MLKFEIQFYITRDSYDMKLSSHKEILEFQNKEAAAMYAENRLRLTEYNYYRVVPL